MPDLRFSVLSVAAAPDASRLEFVLQMENAAAEETIERVRLNAQLHIQPGRRRYSKQEQAALQSLFGEPERWHVSLHPLFWASTTLDVPFGSAAKAECSVAFAADSDDAALTYCHALQEGEIPVEFMFSGTIFYTRNGPMQVAFIPWAKETACRIPLSVWKQCSRSADAASDSVPVKERTWAEIVEHAVMAAGRRKG